MTDLSPAAQAVLDAFTEDNSLHDWKHNHYNIDALAAAFRAAAGQVVPDQQEPASSPHMGNFITNARWRQCQAIRTRLLAIADELEAQ
jgi:hypothetical protein